MGFSVSLGYDHDPDRLQTLGLSELEQFIQRLAARRNRASMQHVVAHLRAFLRWLANRNYASDTLANQIDTPRVYRDEQLPRALPWEVVLRFLDAIDRSSVIGRRDYAMFLLITTYGLAYKRGCDANAGRHQVEGAKDSRRST